MSQKIHILQMIKEQRFNAAGYPVKIVDGYLDISFKEKKVIITEWINGAIAIFSKETFEEVASQIAELPADMTKNRLSRLVLSKAMETTFEPGKGMFIPEWFSCKLSDEKAWHILEGAEDDLAIVYLIPVEKR